MLHHSDLVLRREKELANKMFKMSPRSVRQKPRKCQFNTAESRFLHFVRIYVRTFYLIDHVLHILRLFKNQHAEFFEVPAERNLRRHDFKVRHRSFRLLWRKAAYSVKLPGPHCQCPIVRHFQAVSGRCMAVPVPRPPLIPLF